MSGGWIGMRMAQRRWAGPPIRHPQKHWRVPCTRPKVLRRRAEFDPAGGRCPLRGRKNGSQTWAVPDAGTRCASLASTTGPGDPTSRGPRCVQLDAADRTTAERHTWCGGGGRQRGQSRTLASGPSKGYAARRAPAWPLRCRSTCNSIAPHAVWPRQSPLSRSSRCRVACVWMP